MSAFDVSILKEAAGVDTIVSLQEPQDSLHWGVSVEEIEGAAASLGIRRLSCPLKDFDPTSLRRRLAKAASVVSEERRKGRRVYLHCTAGLGRAPAVAIATMWWEGVREARCSTREDDAPARSCLSSAYEALTSIRPCGPNREAIRSATQDILEGWAARRDAEADERLADVRRSRETAFESLGEGSRSALWEEVDAIAKADAQRSDGA